MMTFYRSRSCGWVRLCSRCIFLVACITFVYPGLAQVKADILPLNTAIKRALEHNPSLQVFALQQSGLRGLHKSAALRPIYQLEADVENFGGTGEQGRDSTELTLALSSVIEMGGKRDARVSLVNARSAVLEAERKAEALDLLGRLTQGFIEALASQERLSLAQDALQLAEATLNTVQKRAKAGAAPEAEVLRAKATLAQARLNITSVRREFEIQKMALAALWGKTSVDFDYLDGNLFDLPQADSFEAIYERVKSNPAIQVYASERRLKEAELRLARAGTSTDIEWRLGVRHFEETGDTGLVAGVRLPLFSSSRNRGDIRAALAERDAVELHRKSALLSLHARLYEAYLRRQQNVDAVTLLNADVIPALNRALDETRRAYETGRYSYVDLTAAQRELLNARRALIDAATSALLYGAVIEQYTAEPLSASAAY